MECLKPELKGKNVMIDSILSLLERDVKSNQMQLIM